MISRGTFQPQQLCDIRVAKTTITAFLQSVAHQPEKMFWECSNSGKYALCKESYLAQYSDSSEISAVFCNFPRQFTKTVKSSEQRSWFVYQALPIGQDHLGIYCAAINNRWPVESHGTSRNHRVNLEPAMSLPDFLLRQNQNSPSRGQLKICFGIDCIFERKIPKYQAFCCVYGIQIYAPIKKKDTYPQDISYYFCKSSKKFLTL